MEVIQLRCFTSACTHPRLQFTHLHVYILPSFHIENWYHHQEVKCNDAEAVEFFNCATGELQHFKYSATRVRSDAKGAELGLH